MARARNWNLGDRLVAPAPAPGLGQVPPVPLVPAPTRGRVMVPEDRWLDEWLGANEVALPPAVRAAYRNWLKTFQTPSQS